MSEFKRGLKYNISIAGVGGTGVLTLAGIISQTAIDQGYKAIMTETHGLSQRMGSVVSDVRIGDVHGFQIPKYSADVLIGVDPVEALRYIFKVKKDGVLIMNEEIIVPPEYARDREKKMPTIDELIEQARKFVKSIYVINAKELAEKAGLLLTQNTVLFGALTHVKGFPFNREALERSVKLYVPQKYLAENEKAFSYGADPANLKQI